MQNQTIQRKEWSSIDALIAGTAVANNLILVTRNTKEFQILRVKIGINKIKIINFFITSCRLLRFAHDDSGSVKQFL